MRAVALSGQRCQLMALCIWPVVVEALLRFDDSSPARRGRFRPRLLILVCALFVAACSKSPSPAAPEPAERAFVGTWTGSITSKAIGPGTATVVLDMQLKSPTVPLVSGMGSFGFPDPTFSTTGTVSGGTDPTGTLLVLIFSRRSVPCPGDPGGVAQQTIAANLTVTTNHLGGDYIAGACPGGTMDLVRK
jgi:hypothetical protein